MERGGSAAVARDAAKTIFALIYKTVPLQLPPPNGSGYSD